jgi:cation transport ATPase
MIRRTSATAPKLDHSGIAVLRTAGSVYDIINQSIQLSLLSGDDIGAVQHIAAQIGISSDEARSRCSPSDKQQYIQSLLGTSVGNCIMTVTLFLLR